MVEDSPNVYRPEGLQLLVEDSGRTMWTDKTFLPDMPPMILKVGDVIYVTDDGCIVPMQVTARERSGQCRIERLHIVEHLH